MAGWKAIVTGAVLASLVIFIFQNREVLQLRFLFWEFETRRAFVLMAVFGGGFLLGWLVATVTQLGARSREAAAQHHAVPPSPGERAAQIEADRKAHASPSASDRNRTRRPRG